MLGMMGHAFNTRTQVAEAGGSLWIWEQRGLHSETLTQEYVASYIFLYFERNMIVSPWASLYVFLFGTSQSTE